MQRVKVGAVTFLCLGLSATVVGQQGSTPSRSSRDVLELASPVKGIVVAIMVKEGDKVVQGDVLLKLDDRMAQLAFKRARGKMMTAEAKLELAKAQLQLAQMEWKRTDALIKQNAASKEDLEKARFGLQKSEADQAIARSTLEVARVEIEAASLDLDHHIVRSPVAGVVVDVLRLPGEATKDLETVMRLKISKK